MRTTSKHQHKAVKMLAILLAWMALSVGMVSSQTFGWVRQFPGSGADYANASTLDGGHNHVVVGMFNGTIDVDPGPGATLLTSTGQDNSFVLKISEQGNMIWGLQLSGNLGVMARRVAVTSAGEVVVAGELTGSGDFDPGPGIFNLVSQGGTDVFIVKLDSAGNFLWARSFGSAGLISNEFCEGLVIDGNGDVLASGTFQSTVDFDPGPGNTTLTSMGDYDAYVMKLTSAGNFVWARRIGNFYRESCTNLELDPAGNILYAGTFEGTIDLNPWAGTACPLGASCSAPAVVSTPPASARLPPIT